MNKICATCKKSFFTQTAQKYCSVKCHYKSPKCKTVTRICQNCGEQFQISPSRLKHGRGKNCSPKCQYASIKKAPPKAEHVIHKCLYCHKSFPVLVSYLAIKQKGMGKYCSRKCMNSYRQGVTHPLYIKNKSTLSYGPNWKAQRQKALERDNHICQECRTTEKLGVHHIVPFRLFDSYEEADRLENLLTVCLPCHRTLEAIFQAKERASKSSLAA